jgi:hypothetical protein
VGSILLDARKHHVLLRGSAAAIIQLIKASIEVVAVLTGLNYFILRHRAMPVTEAERSEFSRVFASASSLAAAIPAERRAATYR